MITDYIDENVTEMGIITKNQHEFRKGHYYKSNLLTFNEELSCSLEKGRAIDVIYPDFAKALDTVPHKCLAYKLCTMVLEGTIN